MSIITTFETPCRALASATSPDENASRLLVGTLSPNKENFIHFFEYKDDSNSLAKVSFKFPFGEVWNLATSKKHPNLFSGVVCKNGRYRVSVFKLPPELDRPIEDDFGLSDSSIEESFQVIKEDRDLTPLSLWHPDDGDQILTCNNGLMELWDTEQQKQVLQYSIPEVLSKSYRSDTDDKLHLVHRATDLRWSSMFNCSVIAAAIGPKIYGFDTRIPDHSPSSICWLIEDDRCNRIRSIDFNPNSQYYLASGGDDCKAKFWDLRRTYKPVLQYQNHTHWIWSIRYNPFHDQLVLSAGSDCRAVLMRVQSIASETYDPVIEEDDNDDITSVDGLGDQSEYRDGIGANFDDNDENDIKKDDNDGNLDKELGDNELRDSSSSKVSVDGVVKIYDEHDDSIYGAEWISDPWIFATIGFESRLIINKVPKEEKFNILFR